ncbi:argininosuccinate synthase [Chloroflexota bacterium]
MADKVILAYSGGVDTSVAIHWLKENYGLDVITLIIDVGNEKDFTQIQEKALKVGASKALIKHVQGEFVRDYVFPALQADALYEGQYPLATALNRPLIDKLLVEVAREEGASAVAHGCTGKGNDQVRFDIGIISLAPDLKIIAPAREWGMTREETIAYAKKYDIPLPVTSSSPYSIDECLWGKAIECGILEDPWVEPPEDAFTWTVSLDKTPDKPEYVEIEFEQGIPVVVNNKKMDGVSLIQYLNELAGKHGFGRIDVIEDRVVGIKSREIYEAPAALLLLQAHKALQAMTLSRDQLRFKQIVAIEYADLVYNGFWFSTFHQDLTAYVKNTQRFVSGTVRCKLFKGSSLVVGRKSPNSLYSFALATYDKGDEFKQSDSAPFIRLLGLPVKIQAQVLQKMEQKGKNKG